MKENIGEFFKAVPRLGIDSMPFVTADLMEEKRPTQVLKGILRSF